MHVPAAAPYLKIEAIRILFFNYANLYITRIFAIFIF